MTHITPGSEGGAAIKSTVARRVLPVAVLAALAAALLASLFAHGDSDATAGSPPDESSPPFAVLRGAPESIPEDVRNAMAPVVERFGGDVGSARRAVTPSGDLWILGAGDQMCLFKPESELTSYTCADLRQVAVEGLTLSSRPSPQAAKATGRSMAATDVAGVFPDGVASIAITDGRGRSKTVPVRENGVVTTLPQSPASLRFSDRSDRQRVVDLGDAR